MNLLLDTSVFLWMITDDDRLSATLRSAVRDPDNRVFLSVVSVWEIVIKHQIHKLTLPRPAWGYVTRARERHAVESLALEEAALVHLAKLPAVHRDPFDRMLVCQAIEHNLLLATADEVLHHYPVKTIG